VVGGYGNDLIFADGDNDVIVAGPGNETIVGGATGIDKDFDKGSDFILDQVKAGETWSATYSQGELDYTGLDVIGDLDATLGGHYQGNVDGSGNPSRANNTTIFGGSGNDVILLSNGNNEVELGT